MNKKRWRALIFGALTVGMTVFIIANSLKTGEESGNESDFFVGILNRILGLFGIEAEQDILSLIIRKTAHFSEYLVLGVLSSLFIGSLTKIKALISLSAVYCFITAVCDEFLAQASTVGRGPSRIDVLIDASGAVTGGLIILLVIYFKERKSAKNG